MDINTREIPTREALQDFAEQIPEINVAAVQFLLQFLNTSAEIHRCIFDVLEKDYRISEGKFTVMIILYQSPDGISPSKLAEKASVTRATISVMLQRLIRDGLACSFAGCSDGRAKLVALTEEGRALMAKVLPDHFLRTAKLVEDLTEAELGTLLTLLKKIKN